MRSLLKRDLQGWPLVAVSFLLFAAGMLNDPPWKFYSPMRRVEFLTEPQRITASLLRDGRFADPFAPGPTGETAHAAPAFPVIEWVIVKAFGFGTAGWLAIRFLPALALSAQFALLPCLARWLGFGAWTGVLAAVFGLIVKAPREEMWEAHLAGLSAILLTVAMSRWRSSILAGLLAGLTLYVQPLFAPIYCLWAWRQRLPLTVWLAALLSVRALDFTKLRRAGRDRTDS